MVAVHKIKALCLILNFPQPIDPQDTGESLEKNALPWDNIRSAKYQKVDDLENNIKT